MSNDRRRYINCGLGFVRQLRFNVRPEVTVFSLGGNARRVECR